MWISTENKQVTTDEEQLDFRLLFLDAMLIKVNTKIIFDLDLEKLTYFHICIFYFIFCIF